AARPHDHRGGHEGGSMPHTAENIASIAGMIRRSVAVTLGGAHLATALAVHTQMNRSNPPQADNEISRLSGQLPPRRDRSLVSVIPVFYAADMLGLDVAVLVSTEEEAREDVELYRAVTTELPHQGQHPRQSRRARGEPRRRHDHQRRPAGSTSAAARPRRDHPSAAPAPHEGSLLGVTPRGDVARAGLAALTGTSAPVAAPDPAPARATCRTAGPIRRFECRPAPH